MFGLGFWHILILIAVIVLLFGSRRLPQMGRSLGGSIRGFKDAITERHEQQDAEAEAEAAKPAQLTQTVPTAPAVPPAQPAVDPREHDTVL